MKTETLSLEHRVENFKEFIVTDYSFLFLQRITNSRKKKENNLLLKNT